MSIGGQPPVEDAAFNALHHMVASDLCALGTYTPADDNDNEEYDELYCHQVEEEPAIYLIRRDPAARTLTITAHDYYLRDIDINSPEDWEPHRRRMASERKLVLDAVPDDEAKAMADESMARARELDAFLAV